MAEFAQRGDFIEPWPGTGWPTEIFLESFQEDSRYFCTRNECKKVLRDPVQLACGHRLCKKCLDYIFSLPPEQQLCDACKEETYDDEMRSQSQRPYRTPEPMEDDQQHKQQVDSDLAHQAMSIDYSYARIDRDGCIPDRAANREIGKLQVRCPYKCQDNDTKPKMIRTLEKHMAECKNRYIACEKCKDTVSFSKYQEHKSQSCPYRQVECPNGCGKRGLLGKDLSKHQAECENKPPICRLCKNTYEGSHHEHLIKACYGPCPFGCANTGSSTQMVDHLNDPKYMGSHVLALQEALLGVRETLKSSTQAGAAGISQAQISTILDRLLQLECRAERSERRLGERVEELTQATAEGLLRNAEKAESNRSALEELEGLFRVLANDVHLLTSYDTTFRHLTQKVTKQENETAERLAKLEGLSNVRVAELEDQKTALRHFQMTSFNGRLVWRIDRVKARREEAHIRHSVYSHPFYTEVYGYKMCARLYFNGDGNGKNSHISLFFVVMKGDFDALLPWPFQQKVTMKLKNQAKKRQDVVEKFRPEPSSSSFARPKNEMNIASGCPQFATQELVFEPQNGFVVEDTMFIEIIVDNSYEALHGLNVSVQETTRGSSSAAAYGK